MRLPLLIFTLVATALAQNGNFPKLFCNRLYGNYVTCCDHINVQFGRALEPGDKITINGTVHPNYYKNRINIRDASGAQVLLHTRTTVPGDSPRRYDKLYFLSFLNGHWLPEWKFGVNPYVGGQPMQISIVWTGSSFMFYSGNVLIHDFVISYPPSTPAMYLELSGGYTTNWIQVECARPLFTTTTKRHRIPHRDLSSYDDDDDEFCD